MRARGFISSFSFVAVVSAGRLAVACSGSGAPPSPSVVAADAPDVFHWYEAAVAVGEARVTKVPGFSIEGHGHAGLVELSISKALKGVPPKTASLQQAATPCGGYSTGLRRVVFLNGAAKVIGVAPIELVPAITQYGAASEGARLKLVARWASEKDSLLAGAARKRQR